MEHTKAKGSGLVLNLLWALLIIGLLVVCMGGPSIAALMYGG